MPESASGGACLLWGACLLRGRGGGVCSGGVSALGGMSALGGCVCSHGGMSALGGVYSGGCLLWGGVVSQHALRQTPPPENGMTNRCKNITLATTSLRTVISVNAIFHA